MYGQNIPTCSCGCHSDGNPELTACAACCSAIPAPVTPAAAGSIPTEYVKGSPGDHDEPYKFGRKPTTQWPYPFSGVEFARLLIMRGRLRAEKEAA